MTPAAFIEITFTLPHFRLYSVISESEFQNKTSEDTTLK